MDWLLPLYPWVKTAHVIAVIAWMAGMLYLPRLYVYHVDAAPGSELSETLKVMERRLLRGIVNPAMVAVWLLGLALLATPGVADWSSVWLNVKLAAVLTLSALHGGLSRWRRAFAQDRNVHGARFYRIVNEVPAVLMVVIVAMVIARPF